MRLTFILATLAALAVDQLSKWYVVVYLGLEKFQVMEVWPGFISFIKGANDGINFGLLGSDHPWMRWALIALALAICVFLVIWVRKDTRPIAHIFVGLIVGGALGNVIDRLLMGHVVDFLNVTCCGIVNPFVFNLADVAVFAGAIGLVIFVGDRKT